MTGRRGVDGEVKGECIKRFIFTRMAGSRASWHNANGHSRTFRVPSRSGRCIPILVVCRGYCISLINVHIASFPLTTIFRSARPYLLSILRSRHRNVSSKRTLFLARPVCFDLILSPANETGHSRRLSLHPVVCVDSIESADDT